jgi:hypothetical protein
VESTSFSKTTGRPAQAVESSPLTDAALNESTFMLTFLSAFSGMILLLSVAYFALFRKLKGHAKSHDPQKDFL